MRDDTRHLFYWLRRWLFLAAKGGKFSRLEYLSRACTTVWHLFNRDEYVIWSRSTKGVYSFHDNGSAYHLCCRSCPVARRLKAEQSRKRRERLRRRIAIRATERERIWV